jgi:hypothetical protein
MRLRAVRQFNLEWLKKVKEEGKKLEAVLLKV